MKYLNKIQHNKTENVTDKFKKQATYPEGDHTVFNQKYCDHPTRKGPKIN